MTTPRRIVFAGSPDFAVPSLRGLAAGPHRITGVLTQPDRPAGRGRALRESAVKRAAAGLGLEVLQPATLRAQETVEQLSAFEPELIVVVAYGLLLPATVLEMPALGCVNVHASLLPRWRGAAPVQAAILSGDAETGVSIMRMESGLDTGPVYARDRTAIESGETAGELQERLGRLGAELLIQTLPGIIDGTLSARAQPDDGVCYAARIKKDDAPLDWNLPAAQLARQIRAYNPWPVAETVLDGMRMRCFSATPKARPSAQSPGEVVAVSAAGIEVQTGDGVLCLTEVQLPGRQRMAAGDFANGYPLQGKQFERV